MADQITISAYAEVIDKASGALRNIKGAIDNVGEGAKATTGFFGSMGEKVGGIAKSIGGGFRAIGSTVSTTLSKIGNLFGPLQGLTGLLGAGGLTKAITDFAAKSKDILQTAGTLNVTTDALQKFRFAAGSAEVADAALGQLQKTLVNLNKGGKATKSTADLFHALGISMEDIKKGDPEQILTRIITQFEKIQDPMKRTNAGMLIFGKRWQFVEPFIRKGVAGLEEGNRKLIESGIALEQLIAGNEAAGAMKALGEGVDVAKDAIAAALLPTFVPMVKWLTGFIKKNEKLLAQAALPVFIGSIAVAVGALGKAALLALGPWGLLAVAIVAGGVWIIQNWKKVKGWLDKNLPGVSTALETAATAAKKWAKDTQAAVKAGFETGGIAGAMTALWDQIKLGATQAAAWIWDELKKVNWSKLAEDGATLFWQGFQAKYRLLVKLGDLAWESAHEADWPGIGAWIGDTLGKAIILAGKAAVAVGDWFDGLDWGGMGLRSGELFGKSLKLVFWDIPLFFADLLRDAITGAGQADWTPVGAAIDKFFSNLISKALGYGAQFMKQFIIGLRNEIPGVQAAIDAVKWAGRTLGVQSAEQQGDVGAALAAHREPVNENLLAYQRGLLSRFGGGGGGGGDRKSNVGITINNNAGADVSATTSGAPLDLSTRNVGASTFATGTP